MEGPIAFYVHHHGNGHRARTEAILGHIDEPVVIFTSDPNYTTKHRNVQIKVIPPDFGKESGQYVSTTSAATHYLPAPSPLYSRRTAVLVEHLCNLQPSVLVVDVSTEVALQARLCGIPTIIVRQHGERTDLPHAIAYHDAVALIAPFPSVLEDVETPNDVVSKTEYTGVFSRYVESDRVDQTEAKELLALPKTTPMILLMTGNGGTDVDLKTLTAVADAHPKNVFVTIGQITRDRSHRIPKNLRIDGWTADPSLHLSAADVVATSAGHNCVMEAATFQSSLITIPEERPFHEQHRKCAALENAGLSQTLGSWNASVSEWSQSLDKALSFDRRLWDPLLLKSGARSAAETISKTSKRIYQTGPAPNKQLVS